MSAVLAGSRLAMRRVLLTEAVEINPKTDRSKLTDDTPVSFVPMAAVGAANGQIDVGSVRPYREVKKGYTHFRDGDVLFAKVTPCMENGKMAVARQLESGLGFGSTEFHVLRPRDGVDSQYIYHFVSSQNFRNEAARHMTGAVGLRRVPTGFLEGAEIPLPHIDVQRRIVADIEKQFSRLDEAVADLERVKANIQRYKTSTLKSAVEGRLVENEALVASRTGRVLESGDQLFQRILGERRAKWNGRGPCAAIDTSSRPKLPSLPESWVWVPFGIMGADPFNTVQTGPFGAQLHNTEFLSDGVPVIAVGNLTGTGFKQEGLYFISASKARQLAKYDVWAGDILFARSGATLGKVCVAPAGVTDWRMTGHILRARVNDEFLIPDFAVYALSSLPAVTKQIFGSIRGVTRPGFNTSLLESIWIPLAPLVEQRRIVAEVERRLSLVREVEAEVDANLTRAAALRQSTLTKLFNIPVP